MPDYKELYFKMLGASEDAIRILVQAQQECEELYLQRETAKLVVLDREKDLNNSGE